MACCPSFRMCMASLIHLVRASCTWRLLSTFLFSSALLQVFFGHPLALPLWPCDAHCNNCFTIPSSLLRLCPSEVHCLLLSWNGTGSWSVFLHNSWLPRCWFYLASVYSQFFVNSCWWVLVICLWLFVLLSRTRMHRVWTVISNVSIFFYISSFGI